MTDKMRPAVNFSCKSQQPKTTIKAGVAAVMTEPVCADVSIVPVSCVTIDAT